MKSSFSSLTIKKSKSIYHLSLALLISLLVNISVLADLGGSGGEIFYQGGFTIHVFTENGTFVPPFDLNTVEVLVVAGGGGGGGALDGTGAGGGAGGLIFEELFTVSGPIAVVVGQGGSGGAPGQRGLPGQDSSFDSLVAIGGGGGGSSVAGQVIGGDGGSGGGGGSAIGGGGFTAPGQGVPGQGNDGGGGFRAGQSENRAGGGGGGAGEPGIDAQNRNAGAGGAGLEILGFAAFGDNGFFAGGGGGGGSTAGSGGIGGGGAGQAAICGAGSDGIDETGGGGGGAFCISGVGASGGDGGSGIVIVRYETIPEIKVEGDVCLELGESGYAIDDTSTISWLGSGNNKITVAIEQGQLPANLELRVNSALANQVILSTVTQDFITNIQDEKVTNQTLIYELFLIGSQLPPAGETILTVKYTIVEQ